MMTGVSEGGVDTLSGVVEVSRGIEKVEGGSVDETIDDEVDKIVSAVGGGGINDGVLDGGVREGNEKLAKVEVEVKDGRRTVAVCC